MDYFEKKRQEGTFTAQPKNEELLSEHHRNASGRVILVLGGRMSERANKQASVSTDQQQTHHSTKHRAHTAANNE